MHFATQVLQISWKGLNHLEVAPIKNLFFLAILKYNVKDSFRCNKQMKAWEKPSLQYKLIIDKHCLAWILLI